jgi:hypothetical protein
LPSATRLFRWGTAKKLIISACGLEAGHVRSHASA